MEYEKIVKGKFLSRPNRFVALVEIQGETVKAHVKNTGRCKELLLPGAEIYLEDFAGRMGTRKLRYSLISVKKGETLINMDSSAPNKVVGEALSQGKLILPGMEELVKVKPEQTFGNSRFDFFVEDKTGKKGYIEVKGVTLEVEGIARFPDAPTVRGIKHIEELMVAADQGYGAYLIFVIQMEGISSIEPNDETHKAFGDAL
ncbi:MAG: DNA/RNA nuclease SfsA, partial [Anaerovoracaceae bacterium]